MLTNIFQYNPKGLTKEEVLAEFLNLQAYEQQEILDYLIYHTELNIEHPDY